MLLVLLLVVVLGKAEGRQCKECHATKAADLFASFRHQVCRKCNTKKSRAQQAKKAANTAPKDRSKCGRCKATKAAEYFGFDKSQPGGLSVYCKECKSMYVRGRTRRYQADREKAQSLTCRSCNQTKPVHEMLQSERKCLECRSTYKAAYDRRRYATDEHFKIRQLLSSRVSIALKGTAKSESTMDLLGCTMSEFKQHIERQFAPGMNWSNQGQWHLDHIVACANWDLTQPAEQVKCFHYSNYQPLWAHDNLVKSSRRGWLPAAEAVYPNYNKAYINHGAGKNDTLRSCCSSSCSCSQGMHSASLTTESNLCLLQTMKF